MDLVVSIIKDYAAQWAVVFVKKFDVNNYRNWTSTRVDITYRHKDLTGEECGIADTIAGINERALYHLSQKRNRVNDSLLMGFIKSAEQYMKSHDMVKRVDVSIDFQPRLKDPKVLIDFKQE